MSHPDPLFDPDNAYEDDDMMIEDENYDDYCDYHGIQNDEDWADFWKDEYDSYDDSMDGDMESGLASAGWGTDEDYGFYGDDEY